MKLLILCVTIPLLASCAMLHSDDPASLAFDIPIGSILSLNKTLPMAESDTHVSIQHGKLINDNAISYYDVNCRLDFRAFGPRDIKPENFTVKRTEDGSEWLSQPAIMRFYTQVYLASAKNTDVIMLECQTYGDMIDSHFTVAEMQQTLTDLITFEFNLKSVAMRQTVSAE